MSELTRRRFLVGSSVGVTVAMAGAVAGATRVLPALGAHAPAAAPGAAMAEPMVVHVRDLRTGEVSLMVGTTETVYQDRELVDRLLVAARRAGATGRGV